MLDATVDPEFALFTSRSLWMPTPVDLAVISTLLLVISASYIYFFCAGNGAKKVYQLGGFSIVNAWTFFDKRHDFLQSNFDKTGQDLFSFKVFQHEVVAASGDEARKTFFNHKDLDFRQGHQFLRGAIPKLEDIKVNEDNPNLSLQNQRLFKILRRDRIQNATPTLLNDINWHMEALGPEGRMNPFKDIYDIVFRLTIRVSSCNELASDWRSIQSIVDLYWRLEKGITPAGLLLPWFPSTARRHKEQTTKGLYDILSHYVGVRRNAKVPNSDAIDVLIADGLDNATIVGFVLFIIFSGVVNTALIASWSIIYLGADNEWKEKAIAEVQNLLATYSGTTSSLPMHQRLSVIPMSAWEDETPVMENVIRETLRLVKNGQAIRRNLADNLQMVNKTIDKGAFVVYSMADVHLNERYYSEPLKFDPDRFSAARAEDKRGHATFLGWGAGRHPCAGMKVAKFEIKMILALFLSRYDYKLVDGTGQPPKQLPQPNRNDFRQSKPLQPCFLDYRKVAE